MQRQMPLLRSHNRLMQTMQTYVFKRIKGAGEGTNFVSVFTRNNSVTVMPQHKMAKYPTYREKSQLLLYPVKSKTHMHY